MLGVASVLNSESVMLEKEDVMSHKCYLQMWYYGSRSAGNHVMVQERYLVSQLFEADVDSDWFDLLWLGGQMD